MSYRPKRWALGYAIELADRALTEIDRTAKKYGDAPFPEDWLEVELDGHELLKEWIRPHFVEAYRGMRHG